LLESPGRHPKEKAPSGRGQWPNTSKPCFDFLAPVKINCFGEWVLLGVCALLPARAANEQPCEISPLDGGRSRDSRSRSSLSPTASNSAIQSSSSFSIGHPSLRRRRSKQGAPPTHERKVAAARRSWVLRPRSGNVWRSIKRRGRPHPRPCRNNRQPKPALKRPMALRDLTRQRTDLRAPRKISLAKP
jgi:hypothetical protein